MPAPCWATMTPSGNSSGSPHLGCAVLDTPGVGLGGGCGLRLEHLDLQVLRFAADPNQDLALVPHQPAAGVVGKMPEHARQQGIADRERRITFAPAAAEGVTPF